MFSPLPAANAERGNKILVAVARFLARIISAIPIATDGTCDQRALSIALIVRATATLFPLNRRTTVFGSHLGNLRSGLS